MLRKLYWVETPTLIAKNICCCCRRSASSIESILYIFFMWREREKQTSKLLVAASIWQPATYMHFFFENNINRWCFYLLRRKKNASKNPIHLFYGLLMEFRHKNQNPSHNKLWYVLHNQKVKKPRVFFCTFAA